MPDTRTHAGSRYVACAYLLDRDHHNPTTPLITLKKTTAELFCWGRNDDTIRGATYTGIVSTATTQSIDMAPAGFYRHGAHDILCPAGSYSRPGAIK